MKHLLTSATVILALGLVPNLQPLVAQDSASDTVEVSGNKFPTADQAELFLQTPPEARITGELAIQAVQGTPGGESIGTTDIEVHLLHRGVVVQRIESELDEHGVVVLEDVPVGMGVTPVVVVTYGEVTYQQTGGLMDASHPKQKIEVVCYDVTEERPDWRIPMRHVMVARGQGGLMVSEIVVIENPAQRTWLGTMNDAGKRVTTGLPLPEGATQVTLGRGFHKWCCTTLEPGRLCNHLPLMPERTEMQFDYFLPAKDDQAVLNLATEAPVDQMMVVFPAELEAESVRGLELGGTDSFGNQQVRFYRGESLAIGDFAEVVLTGLQQSSGATVAVNSPAGNLMRSLVAIVAGVVVLVALILLLSRRSPGPAATTS